MENIRVISGADGSLNIVSMSGCLPTMTARFLHGSGKLPSAFSGECLKTMLHAIDNHPKTPCITIGSAGKGEPPMIMKSKVTVSILLTLIVMGAVLITYGIMRSNTWGEGEACCPAGSGSNWPWMGGRMMLYGGLPLLIVLFLLFKEDRGVGDTVSECDPRSILGNRYARGEITREDYLRISKDLQTRDRRWGRG